MNIIKLSRHQCPKILQHNSLIALTVPCKVADANYLYNLREFPDSERVAIKRVSKNLLR